MGIDRYNSCVLFGHLGLYNRWLYRWGDEAIAAVFVAYML